MAQGTRQTNSLFLWSLLQKAEENYPKESEEPSSTRKGSRRALAWVWSQAAGDGWAGLSEEGKRQLGPDGPGPGTAKGMATEPVGNKGASEVKAEGLEPRVLERPSGEEWMGQEPYPEILGHC